jgi:hypothetical protein
MAFNIGYIGDLAQKFLALEPEYQQLKAEREFYLRQIGSHAGFLGDDFPMDEATSETIVQFIKIFLKSNPQYNSVGLGLSAIDFTPPKSTPAHFGVRDYD